MTSKNVVTATNLPTMAASMIAFIVLILAGSVHAQTGACTAAWGGSPRTVLMVADDGAFSGTPEDKVYIDNLSNKVSFPAGLVACPRAFFGTVMNQPVAVITSGIGPMAAALCTFDLMNECGPLVKDIFYSGTSGWSPQLGGVLNNNTCKAANDNGGTPQITRIGDVCVSPLSVNWDCRKASWTNTSSGSPNECTFPEQLFDSSSSFLFGLCQFPTVTQSQLALSDEVLGVAAQPATQAKLPRRNNVIQASETSYWAEMAKGTKLTYPSSRLSQTSAPVVWNYQQCMEIDSQFFYSGAPWDMVARSYVASTLNAAALSGVSKKTQLDVIAVSAMEAIGLSQGLLRYYEKNANQPKVAFTVVRGQSNQLIQPVKKAGGKKWKNGKEIPEDFAGGYAYAISTSATVVLSTLQARCVAAGGGGACSFNVTYS